MAAKPREFNEVIGIDVGKSTLAIYDARRAQRSEVANTPATIRAYFKARPGPRDQILVVCETTGGYERALLRVCEDLGVAAHRANTFQAKAFIRSLGRLGKTDALDAHALAVYGQERQGRLALWRAPSVAEQQLTKLLQRRNDLVKMQTQEKNRLQAPDQDPVVKTTIRAVLRTLTLQLAAVDAAMAQRIQAHPALRHKHDLMTAIPGVGAKTAQALVTALPELGQLNRRQVASLAGLAPHPRDSGAKTGRRTIRGGRQAVRCALYMAALSAARYHPNLKTFYQRLIDNGKRPIVALIAVMRKLLTIINAQIRDAMYANTPIVEQS